MDHSIGPRSQKRDAECLVRKPLLMLDVAIHRDESVHAIHGTLQELTIL